MFPFSKSNGAPETTPETDPAAPQNPPRADRTAEIRARAEAHADGVLRGRSEFARHHVRHALISAFISGADFTGGEATQQPEPPKPAGERPQLTDDELAQREQDEASRDEHEQQGE